MLKHGILGLLNYGDMTGYEIMTIFRESLSHFWTAQTSQIYRELQGLENEGWITSKHVAQTGRPDKKILSITGSGKQELDRWLEDDRQFNVRLPLLMKTFFRGELDADKNIAFFRSLAKNPSVFPGGYAAAQAAADRYAAIIGDSGKALFWKFTIDFGLMYEKMLQQWCERCIRELKGMQHEHSAD